MKKKIIFLGFSLIISSCATTSQEIDQLEEQIVALENKENLTPEEEAELNQLIDKQEKLIEDDESVYEEIEMEDEDENKDLNDSIFSKYYVKNDPDPKFNPGKFLERHCFYDGKYKDIYYEGTPLSDVPLDEDLKLDFYPNRLGIFEKGLFRPNIVDYNGEHGEQFGQIECLPDWSLKTGIGGDTIVQSDEPSEIKRNDIYGLSFYDRIFPFYSIKPESQQGLWGQWIQAPGSHPYGPAGGTIEGGLGVYNKFGHTKYPTYMASGAPLFYNPHSSLFGWGFYEVRVPCDCYGGVQLTNKVIPIPAGIRFDEDQEEFVEDGGIYFGHGWFALPIFSGETRQGNEEPTTDIGKLTWTFIANSKQYSGPMWAYVPEFWHRRINRWNALEMLQDGEDQVSKELYDKLIQFLGGRLKEDEILKEIKNQNWYIDDVDDYNYETGGLFWTQEKNTLAYTSTPYAAIGSEMGELPAFIEYDDKGDLYLKIFPPALPATSDKEYFTLDGRSYDVNLYNYFVDFFKGDVEINRVISNFDKFSKPMIAEDRYEDRDRPDLKMNDLFIGEAPDYDTLNNVMVSWNVYLKGATENGETNTFWDWSDIKDSENRNLSQYYKVEVPSSKSNLQDYRFIPVEESVVPDVLTQLEMNTIERTVSYMPHIKSNEDKDLISKIKDDMDEVFGLDSNPFDFSCWDCTSDGCDPTIYESTLDDGTIVKYRWYKFKDQPTFMYLKKDYPEIYTDEYLDLIQSRIEQMHKEWGDNQEFIPTPNSIENFHLVELDNGQIVKPPKGKEYGWVPLVLEMEAPFGEYQTTLNHSEFIEFHSDEEQFRLIKLLP